VAAVEESEAATNLQSEWVVGWDTEFEKVYRKRIATPDRPKDFTDKLHEPPDASENSFMVAEWEDGIRMFVPDLMVKDWRAREKEGGTADSKAAMWTGKHKKSGRQVCLCNRSIDGQPALVLELLKTKDANKGQLGQLLVKHVADDLDFATQLMKELATEWCNDKLSKDEFKGAKQAKIKHFNANIAKTDKAKAKPKDGATATAGEGKRVTFAAGTKGADAPPAKKPKSRSPPPASASGSDDHAGHAVFHDMMAEGPPL